MKPATYLWTACEEAASAPAPIGGSSSKKTGTPAGGKETGATIIRVYRTERSQQIWIRELGCIRHPSALNAMLYVPRSPGLSNQYQDDRRSDQVWIAGTDKCITIYMAHDPEKGKELGQIILNSEPKVMMYSNAMVWVGLANGSINIYRRGLGGLWDTISPNVLLIGSEPISSIALAAAANPTPAIFATSGRRIAVIDQSAMDIERNINIGSGVAANENKSAANCDRLAAIATDNINIPADAKITHTATAGVGLWVALSNCSFVSLYHTESLQHIENVDLTPCVDMVMGLRDGGNVSTAAASVKRSITVTAMSASPAAGLLWIGTNVGLAITVPLPRLGGLPICSKSLSVSYHGMFGPIRMFLTLNHTVQSEEHVQAVQKKVYRMSTSSQVTIEEEPTKNSSSRLDQIEKTPLSARYSSPRTSSMRHSAGLPPHHPHHESVFRKSSDFTMDHSMRMEHSGNTSINSTPGHNSSNNNSSCTMSASRRFSKTLPRGFSLSAATADCGSGVGDSVYGLYGDLLNVADYDSETGYGGQSVSGVNQTALANCHKSDPELNTIPYRVSTLDRRMTMKLARPRSLDLSSWSVESRSSSHTSSDGSDRSAPSPSVSRNASFMSHKSVGGASITMNGGGEISRNASMRKPGGAGSTTTNNAAATSAGKQHKLEGARTVTTIMGGRGYHRWHPIKRLATNLAKMNDTDACLVAWEQKT